LSDMNDKNDNKDSNGPNNKPQGGGFRSNRFALIVLVGVLVLFAILLIPSSTQGQVIPYSRFYTYLDAGQIGSVQIVDRQYIQGTLKGSGETVPSKDNGDANKFVTYIPYDDKNVLDKLIEKGVTVQGSSSSSNPMMRILDFVPWILLIVIFWMMFRQMQGNGNKAFSFGKSKAKRYNDAGKRTVFADVAGQREAKYELEEVVEFLKNPGKFTKMGAKIPKGVLLVGMPGTGKTLLAKACAGEAGVPFFHMSGSDFVEMFVGVGASRVRDLFEQGRKNAPCILFIDELDAVGRTRGAGYGGGHDEREQTLNQMLVEMDGFDTKDAVIVLAATNRPDVLDPALLRPGRFDRQVVVDMPDMEEREAILKIHAAKIPLADEIDLKRLARGTPGASGADIANLVNEAALYAARAERDKVIMADFEEAIDKVFLGVARRSKVIGETEKLATSYHEAGHALLHFFLKHSDPLHKVTVIPRGRTLGVAWSAPDKDVYTRSQGYYEDRIVIAYGGFVAEELIYGVTTSGTSNDIKQATELARRMVCEWGMSPLGPISYGQEEEPIFIGKEIARHKDYSEQTAQRIDQEINVLLRRCLDTARTLIANNRDKLESLAQELVKRETLTGDEVRTLFGMDSIPGEAKADVTENPSVPKEENTSVPKDETSSETKDESK